MNEEHLRQARVALDFWNHGPQPAAEHALALSLSEREAWGHVAGFKKGVMIGVLFGFALAQVFFQIWSRM